METTAIEDLNAARRNPLTPTSLFFAPKGRLLVTPGLYAFDPR